MIKNQELRRQALELAVHHADNDAPVRNLVEVAELYYAFLLGKRDAKRIIARKRKAKR